jgi:hemerythrin-like domain-containing protein
MMPIAPLMIEHRLIERMIAAMRSARAQMSDTGAVDVAFIDAAVDFIRVYADRTHHGKEEDILFRDLAQKPLAPDLGRTMRELIEEHGRGRAVVRQLVSARDCFVRGAGEALRDIVAALDELVYFYPRHIEKEDRHFFLPVMEHFTQDEQAKMLEEMWEFDRRMLHERYRQVVEQYEPPKPV